jgi:transposase
VLEEGRRVLITDPGRFDGVRVLGVDEHVWRHTRRGDKFVTVIIDLTGVREGTGPARLLDMVEGRSKQAFIAWLAAQSSEFRARIEVVAMDGFTGFKTAATDQLPDATAVLAGTPGRTTATPTALTEPSSTRPPRSRSQPSAAAGTHTCRYQIRSSRTSLTATPSRSAGRNSPG